MSWRKIKAEYVAGGISQRKLAEKYGIAWGTLRKRANLEKWNDKRKSAEKKAEQKVEQKTAEIVADNATLCEQIKPKLLRKLAVMVDQFPDMGAGELRKKDPDGTELIYRIKDIATVYKDLTDDMVQTEQTGNELLQSLLDLERRAEL